MTEEPIKVYRAKEIITMDPTAPRATAIAVQGDRIVGIGDSDDVDQWGVEQIDDSFDDCVLLPGFIEAHSHVMSVEP